MTTWFVTGANRGLGLEIARAALAAGDQVVAAARQPEALAAWAGRFGDRLLTVPVDVTGTDAVTSAVASAMARFGRIDVLVNNAGYGQLGAFETVSPTAIERQFATNVFGAFAMARAVLPIMRAQRSGHIVNMSSIAGLTGFEGASVYCSTKFALEGWSEALGHEVERFGIRTTLIEPGRFRTDFLDRSSVRYGDVRIADYEDQTVQREAELDAGNHRQAGDPVRLASALIHLVRCEQPPVRFAAGKEGYDVMVERSQRLQGEAQAWRDLSFGCDFVG